MSDEVVERVAKVIFAADNRPGADWDEHAKDWERDEYRALARAAIDEIQVIGEEMMARYSITVGLPDDKKTL